MPAMAFCGKVATSNRLSFGTNSMADAVENGVTICLGRSPLNVTIRPKGADGGLLQVPPPPVELRFRLTDFRVQAVALRFECNPGLACRKVERLTFPSPAGLPFTSNFRVPLPSGMNSFFSVTLPSGSASVQRMVASAT